MFILRGWILGWLFSASALAATYDGVSYTIHHHYVSPRPLGMGDAFVAVANDYNALFYNPAGLARREDGEVNLYFDGALTTSFIQFSKDIQEAQNTTGTDAQKQNAVLDVVEKVYGKTYGFRLSPASGIWVRPKWGIGFIPMDLTTEMTVHKSVGPSVNTTVYADTTLAYGYGDDIKSVESGRMSWGITGKFINRGYFSKSISFIEIAADPNLVRKEDLREGYGIDADIGLLYSPHIPPEGILSLLRLARPTFGAVVRNVMETNFGSTFKLYNKIQTERPEKMYRVIDLGTRWEYPSFWIFGGRGVMDIRDIMHPAFNLRKGLHLGFEFDWTVSSWWKGNYRFGLNQGFFTAGVSAMFTIFNLDFVTYGEDVGTYGLPVENRMYALRLNMNF